ncbi:MAG TPA: hypothetical protein VMU34_19425 [Mycobacterium sp.]|nr:hypothetical protein [Mycobacterium sp.]
MTEQDTSQYVHFERSWGPGFYVRKQLAQAVKALHENVMMITIAAGCPGYAIHHVVNEFHPSPSVVAECLRAGLWEKVEDGVWGGYRILDLWQLQLGIDSMRAAERKKARAAIASGTNKYVNIVHDVNDPGYYLPAEIALQAQALHRLATMVSVLRGRPGLVPDTLIRSVTPNPGPMIRALFISGRWDRVEEGYRIADQRDVDNAIRAVAANAAAEAACVGAGGHRPQPLRDFITIRGVESTCSVCGTILMPDDPIH